MSRLKPESDMVVAVVDWFELRVSLEEDPDDPDDPDDPELELESWLGTIGVVDFRRSRSMSESYWSWIKKS